MGETVISADKLCPQNVSSLVKDMYIFRPTTRVEMMMTEVLQDQPNRVHRKTSQGSPHLEPHTTEDCSRRKEFPLWNLDPLVIIHVESQAQLLNAQLCIIVLSVKRAGYRDWPQSWNMSHDTVRGRSVKGEPTCHVGSRLQQVMEPRSSFNVRPKRFRIFYFVVPYEGYSQPPYGRRLLG